MDRAWAVEQLREFLDRMDGLKTLTDLGESEYIDDAGAQLYDDLIERWGGGQQITDRLVSLDPIMRELMEAARSGLGDYLEAPGGGWSHEDSNYWSKIVRPNVLRAIGIHELGAEAHEKLQPDSPGLGADQFHPWVWEAAAPLWFAGSRQEAVNAAARSVNARLQQKLSRRGVSESTLVREAFGLDPPAPGRPRLRFPGNKDSDTWRSRQQGGMQLGAGCFAGIRNPAAHEDGLVLTEQVALEQLAAFSLLARWIDECAVEKAK